MCRWELQWGPAGRSCKPAQVKSHPMKDTQHKSRARPHLSRPNQKEGHRTLVFPTLPWFHEPGKNDQELYHHILGHFHEDTGCFPNTFLDTHVCIAGLCTHYCIYQAIFFIHCHISLVWSITPCLVWFPVLFLTAALSTVFLITYWLEKDC